MVRAGRVEQLMAGRGNADRLGRGGQDGEDRQRRLRQSLLEDVPHVFLQEVVALEPGAADSKAAVQATLCPDLG